MNGTMRPIVTALGLSLTSGLLLACFFAPELHGMSAAYRWWWAGMGVWDVHAAPRAMLALFPLACALVPSAWAGRIVGLGHDFGQRWLRLPAFGLFSVMLFAFWVFRQTDIRYGDSIFYARQLVPTEAASGRGLYLSYDEMLSSVIGTLGYRHLNATFHLDPVTAYNILFLPLTVSFFALLFHVRGERLLLLSAPAFLMMVAGNWNQPMMAPVEHYAGVTVCLFAFMVFGVEAMRGTGELWRPCLAFSLGAAFHLGIGWFFPALAYMVVRRWGACSVQERHAAVLCLAGPALVYVCLAHFLGFDLGFFFKSHASQVKLLPLLDRKDPYIADNIFYDSVFEPLRLAHLGNLLLLMGYPAVLALAAVPSSLRGGFVRRPEVRFAGVMAAGGLAFIFLWNNELPYYIDQDLFGMGVAPLCLLGALAIGGGDGRGTWLGEARGRVLLAVVGGALLWRFANLLHHSVLSPNYASPWVIHERVYF